MICNVKFEIVPGLQVLDAVQNGTVEMGHTASYYYFGKDPTFAFGTAVAVRTQPAYQPGLVHAGRRQGAAQRVLQGLQRHVVSRGQYRLPDGRLVSQGDQHGRRSEGTQVRIGGFAGRVLQKLGVVPQQLAGGDIYPALEKGTIDAAEWVGPYDDEKLGFNKVAPHYYYPGWWEGGPMLLGLSTWINGTRCRSTIKAPIEQAGHASNSWMMAKYDHGQSAGAEETARRGTKLHAFLAADHAGQPQGDQELYAETAATNPNFKKILESMNNFTANGYQWFQVAELGYDSFMARNAQG